MYCKVTSDVNLNVSKDNDDRSLMFPRFKTFTSLEFRLSAVVAWAEPGLQFPGVFALARNVRI